MHERCADLLRHMIVGNEEISLDEAKDCVTLMRGCSASEASAAIADSFMDALTLLQVGLVHELPLAIRTRLRSEALTALGLLTELCEVEPA